MVVLQVLNTLFLPVLMIRRYGLPSSLALVAILTPILFSSATLYSNAQGSEGTVVRDSQTVLLEGITIPASDYIHLYDATPYMIKVGHVAVKLPITANQKHR